MTLAAPPVSNPALVGALLSGAPEDVRSELMNATLLAPVSPIGDGKGILRSGRSAAGRPLVWAFTDDEALAAWDRRPAKAAVALEGGELAMRGDPGRTVVAINAAGPGACLVGHEPATDSEPSAGRPGPAVTNPLIDPERRQTLRRQLRQVLDRGRRAAEAGGYEQACEEFQRVLDGCGELGDRLHGAATSLELAACLARCGSVELAFSTWERAANILTLFGEADLALTGLLDAAETAAAAGRAEQAERLSIAALDLCAGPEGSDRLVAVWRSLSRSQ